jgi:hypothetical protein
MNWQNILIIIAAVAAAVFGSWIVMPWAIKKGLNVPGVIETTESLLGTAETVVDGLQLLLPENSTLSVVDLIVDYAKKAVDAAEQMYKASQIKAEERKATATSLVNTCLAIVGVERTDEIDKAISGMIEAAVLALPKTKS